METKNDNKGAILVFGIITVILGSALFKAFDFETLKFEKTGLAVVYLITFLASVYFIIKNIRNQSGN